LFGYQYLLLIGDKPSCCNKTTNQNRHNPVKENTPPAFGLVNAPGPTAATARSIPTGFGRQRLISVVTHTLPIQ
jgi:hypothetical protein